ncbi:MAG: phytoene desaturase [Deltaproteobacteria bacterium]|nr:phytoene desaturase [Deltaproteobacteria bacterium]
MHPPHVLVIGAGLGGLSAAASLAAGGLEVEVFEKNDRIGGKLNLLEQDGFSLDLGPSILILPHIFRRVFERAGRRMEDYVHLQELQPQWRCFWEDGTRLDLHPDVARMEAELATLPGATRGWWSFLEYSRELYRFCDRAYLQPGADTFREVLAGHTLGEVVHGSDPLRTMASGIARYVEEPHLRDMLGFFIKYVGSSCYDAPALMNLLPFSQLGYGLWYVTGGMYNLARAYDRLLGELGVRVHLGSEVVRIRTEGPRATGIELADGRFVAADYVVSNMEVVPAHRHLLGEPEDRVRRLEKRLEPAASGLVLHLGVDRIYPQLQHHNFFFSRNLEAFLAAIHRRKELPEDPTIYLVCPTVTNPDLAPSGHSVLKILPHIPSIQDPPFSASDYQALEARVLDKLERMGLEDLKSHVVTRHVLLPEDLERMYRSNRGAIYGVVSHRTQNFAFKGPKRSRRYPNLYFVGGSVNPGGGTPMVTLCGQNVADRILGDVASGRAAHPSSGA